MNSGQTPASIVRKDLACGPMTDRSADSPQNYGEKYYRKSYGDRLPGDYTFILQEIIAFGKPGRILDVGCGIGLFVELAQQWRIDACGVDGSIGAINMALTRVPDLDVKCSVLSEPLPFDDGAFNNVLLNQVIEHLDENTQVSTLREIHRVLSKGGMLYVLSPSAANRRAVEEDPTHCNPLYPSQLRSCLQAAGFSVVREPNLLLPAFDRRPVLSGLLRRLQRTKLTDFFSGTANAIAVRG
jgi:SAM-dependent methyltransferase